MPLSDKLQTIGDSCLDIRRAIQEKDLSRGHGAIGTLASDIAALNPKNIVTKIYKDSEGKYGMIQYKATSSVNTDGNYNVPTGCTLIAAIYPEYSIEISNDVFNGFSSLEYVNLEHMKIIRTRAFKNTKLSNVKLSKITAIGDGCFYGCKNLKTVIIDSPITVLSSAYSNGTFRDCSNLTSVTLPDTLVTIRRECFYDCSALKTVTGIDHLKTIEQSVFHNCTSFGGFTLTDAVTIGINAFTKCQGDPFYLGNNVTTLGNYAFSQYSSDTVLSKESEGCSLSGTIDLPNLTSIGTIVFANTKITEVLNLGTITSLNKGGYSSGVFQRCRSLTKVVLPATLTSIAIQTFYYCTALTTVVLLASTPPTLSGTSAFSGCSSLTYIYVPYSEDHSILNAYKEAAN